MSARNAAVALIVLMALLLAGAGVAWYMHTHQRVCAPVQSPPYGEPTYNPLYALRETLRRDGVKAESLRTLDLQATRLQPGDTVLMLDDPRQLAPNQAAALLDWVGDGGHLLLHVPEADDDLDKDDDLPSRLGVIPGDIPARCQPWNVPGQAESQVFCMGSRFVLNGKARAELRWGDGQDDTLAYARLGYGAGRVDALTSMDFLLNDGLRDMPNRDLARLALAPNYGKGRVYLIYAMQTPSLWRMILRDGWPAWLPLLLALLAWLWMRAQRFGSLLPSPRLERRSLLEHMRASGELLHRYGKAALLYGAVRRAFLARLRRRAPLAAALDGPAQVQAIADHLRWPPDRVRKAFKPPMPRDDAALRETISLLIQMRNLL